MPVETAHASVDHITPHFDGLRADRGIPPPAHQEGMELPTGEHHLNESGQQSAIQKDFPTTGSIEVAEVDSSSLLSSDVSMVQGRDCSSLQEGQSHLQVGGMMICGLHCRKTITTTHFNYESVVRFLGCPPFGPFFAFYTRDF